MITSSTVPAGPVVNMGTRNFELRTGLITMVQANQFCGLPSEDASAHLQHFLELCDTIIIKDVVDTKFWFDGKSLRIGNYQGKPKYLSESANQVASKIRTTSSFQGDGPHWQGQRDMKKICQTS